MRNSTLLWSVNKMVIIPPDADILPPSDDHIFKTLLTHPNAKPVLISVVAAAIERNVLDVTVINNELPGIDVNEKKERLDVNCAIDGGDQVDVEMQCSHVEADTLFDSLSFINKSIYYLTDLHSSQKSKGVLYRNLVRTYQVTFCGYRVFPQWPDFVSRFSLRRPNGEQVSDQINMVVVEMDKLGERLNYPVENISSLEAWAMFFNFVDKPAYRGLINNLITSKKELYMATELLMEISKDDRERAIMRSRRMYETDRFNELQLAEDKGIAKGQQKRNADIVKHMHSEGFSLADIVRATKLSEKEVNDILGL
jgi:predicted transposase/invertase (TIGR01784 family)